MSREGGRIRILHLPPYYKGNYPLFIDLVSGLDRDRYDSRVLYLERFSDEPDELKEQGFRVAHLSGDRRRMQGFSPAVVRGLRSFMEKNEIDIVHTHRYKAAVSAALATLGGRRRPIVWTVHAQRRFRGIQRKLVGLWLCRKLARLVAVSEDVRRDILSSAWGVLPGKVVTVQNGIDPAPYLKEAVPAAEARESLGLPEEGFLIGAVGRLDPKKAHAHLIEAFHGVRLSGADAYLVIAGEGRLRPVLERQLESLGLRERVILMGRCADIPRFLRAIDLFVLSSVSEGLSLALLEAMASGVPVVSTRAAGVPEVAEGVEGCLLVEAGDLRAMAGALEAMYRLSADERSRLGSRNRDRVLQRFTADRMARETMAVYEAVLAEREPG